MLVTKVLEVFCAYTESWGIFATWRTIRETNSLDMQLTRDDLENAADEEDVVRLDADEEKKQQHAEDDDDRRHADEDGRRLESGRQDAVEVAQRSVADAVGAEVDELAQFVEADVADARAAERVADPLRLHEHDDVDDEEAQREQRPAETEAVRAASVDFHRSARHRSLPPRVYTG